MKNKLIVMAVLVAFTGLCASVQANEITGAIGFQGVASASGPSGAGSTTVNFTGPWIINSGTGNYSGLNTITPVIAVNFNKIIFSGTLGAATLSGSVAPLWEFTSGGVTYKFNLDSLSLGVVSPDGYFALAGSGEAAETGYADTYSTWSMTGTGSDFRFALSFDSNTVPDGGTTVGLLGLGLCGCALLGRKLMLA